MSELRWGVKPPFKGLNPTPTVKSKSRRDADEILFENLGHLHETGAITIHDEEVLNESLLALARTGASDLCFLSALPMADWLVHLTARNIEVESGPAPRTGATGPLMSIYLRDPDGNLIEIANQLWPSESERRNGSMLAL